MSSALGVLRDPQAGHVDPDGVTHAVARGARMHGAEIHLRRPVLEASRRAGGGFDVVTPAGTVAAGRVVNAGGG